MKPFEQITAPTGQMTPAGYQALVRLFTPLRVAALADLPEISGQPDPTLNFAIVEGGGPLCYRDGTSWRRADTNALVP
jgi:hypothetical protein